MIKQTKFGWVDLSNIPKRGKLFDWKSSVGKTIEFQYLSDAYKMNIVGYIDWHHIQVSVDGRDVVVANIDNIIKGKLGALVYKRTHDFRYKIGDIVGDTLLITSAYRDGNRRCYDYRCLIDGYEGSILEVNLHRGVGCPVCSNKTVLVGVNDVATTNALLASLFYDTDNAIKYTEHSGKYEYFKCPRCGCKIKAIIYEVSYNGLSCKKCGDGISYPEKFVYNFLQQVGKIRTDIVGLQNFASQHTFDWSKNILHENIKLRGDKIYDFYLPIGNGVCIECHGEQHYTETFYGIGDSARTLAEEQENDEIKMRLALQNGVLSDCYIQLDCRESSVEYIKRSIMSSNLPILLSFTDDQINWDECGFFAMSSRMIEVCDLWNDSIKSIQEIATSTRLCRSTVYKYLRRGEELGIVQDPPKYKKKNKIK